MFHVLFFCFFLTGLEKMGFAYALQLYIFTLRNFSIYRVLYIYALNKIKVGQEYSPRFLQRFINNSMIFLFWGSNRRFKFKSPTQSLTLNRWFKLGPDEVSLGTWLKLITFGTRIHKH